MKFFELAIGQHFRFVGPDPAIYVKIHYGKYRPTDHSGIIEIRDGAVPVPDVIVVEKGPGGIWDITDMDASYLRGGDMEPEEGM